MSTNTRTFLVGPESIAVVANPAKLAIFSPVFDAMFFGSMAETKKDIPLPDDDPTAFKILVDFTETGSCCISSTIVAIDVVGLANKYLMQTLQDKFYEFMCMYCEFDKKYGWHIYECLKMNNAPKRSTDMNCYMDRTLQKCKWYAEEIVQNDSFLTLNIDTIIDFFACEELIISSELVLVVALAKYYDANKSCSIEKIKMALERIHMLSIEPKRLITSGDIEIILKLPNLKEIIQRMFRENVGHNESQNMMLGRTKEIRLHNSSLMYLRSGEFEYKSTNITKYSMGSIQINVIYPMLFHGVIIGVAGDVNDIAIPKLDIVLTLQDSSHNKLVGERFKLNNVNNKGILCMLNWVKLKNHKDYIISVMFMNDIFIPCSHTGMTFEIKDITLENSINCNCCPPFENINAILKGFYLSYDPDENRW